ncbi:MAG: multifunctional oxoglutarate decarboxylase/oxoglutarate dehydrogenase thiamine pyrophosphate-binding subunit/dihydrolipoyllysine-residue succinyltransferase subunit [Ardenticatenaceae bacterium]|nr:multifunctional oxoglutarate decarboxylase/oxoglutarate dehydrogenase thiamine pyrophosphate-binding subunit/dihydrolipoyllysine-residue succinyltransferase subunit [Ardenticatenaceae bacterium]HBY95663.1 multifunctional oxoglutarate decarboxylase/oxoglutarate dehydrogenase thiamine pyrophosphate-binding subunit/dihydrolipoyllysine-residue succinyltransferase subunit [Chloroflexota bacterium]
MVTEEILNTFGPNAEYVQELYAQYQASASSVPESWRQFFASLEPSPDGDRSRGTVPGGNGAGRAAPKETTVAPPPQALPAEAPPVTPSRPAPAPERQLAPYEEAEPLRGVAGLIVENMEESLSLPVATSQRVIPVKVLEENRRLLNQHLALQGGGKVSFTHLIAWAMIQALEKFPHLNAAFARINGQPVRVDRHQINLGVAVDVTRRGGERSLLVPNLTNVGAMTFDEFLSTYDDLIERARTGKLTPEDFQGTTITLTNPGTIGTVASVPRLLKGQGAIIATGVIGYPAEYHAMAPEVLSGLGISKVMTITSTYDHRIIQGAESGEFLAQIHRLLLGEEGFYTRVFADLRVPHRPVVWTRDITPPPLYGPDNWDAVEKQASVLQLIRAYRVRGHLIANLDPLVNEAAYHPDLDPATYGLTIWDYDREFITGGLGGLERATLREILDILRRSYTEHVGLEYMNIQQPEQRQWLHTHFEQPAPRPPLPAEERLRILEQLTEAEAFENFLGRRYVGHKRFSLEGAETLIPVLKKLLDRAAADEMSRAVMGMSHRGRLTTLHTVVGKSATAIFSEFEGYIDPESTQGTGDVKYHLGAEGSHTSPAGETIAVTLASNPSHLEAVNPVVEGMARAAQDLINDTDRDEVLPILIHGDAAFAGQGIVAETLNLAQLTGYRTGGTLHIIVNNQIGFTTAPQHARSTPFPTDLAKMSQVPIFHVNGDDPEAVVRVVELAFDYRQRFHKDVVIDLVVYRRWGHNEADEPSYTQPALYRLIEQHPPVRAVYAGQLAREGIISLEAANTLKREQLDALDQATAGLGERPEPKIRLGRDLTGDIAATPSPETGVDRDTLTHISRVLATPPEDFKVHPKLRRQLERRTLDGNGHDQVDWALGEALAFGSLLLEGTGVRLSGQDSARGTFSQRHAVLYNTAPDVIEANRTYVPLSHLSPTQARFQVYDSMLSEAAVLGFEFGYSLSDRATLVLWEAQFGDFANGAQVIIDQFIVSSDTKWNQESDLTLLLPHGYEGQGPEHSSARPERFLQLAAGGNIEVCYPSTPAQYFHLLRRQKRDNRLRPLVVLTPKSLLRLPAAASPLDEFVKGRFEYVLDDPQVTDPAAARRLILTSGKFYYDLASERTDQPVALVRVEQYYPYPRPAIRSILARYPNATEVVWAQEEPRNMGAWNFIRTFLEEDLPQGRTLRYIGRPASPSSATGAYTVHVKEQSALVAAALSLKGD